MPSRMPVTGNEVFLPPWGCSEMGVEIQLKTHCLFLGCVHQDLHASLG